MNKFKEDILVEYLKWVDEVTEECDWKTHFGPEEIVSKVVDIVLDKLGPEGEELENE